MSEIKNTTEVTEESNGVTNNNGSPAPKKFKKDVVEVQNGEEASVECDFDKDTQKTLEEIDTCQNVIDNLNEKASEEILKVEQKYNKLRKPYFEKRNELIKKIPNFWVQAFLNHAQIRCLLSTEEEECIQHLKNIEVEEFEDIGSGYRIKFHFEENPFFENEVLVKEFHLASTGDPTCTSTEIKWKNTEEGKSLKDVITSKQHKSKVEITFFLWFLENGDASSDDIAEVIKDDLWPNPLQYFLCSEIEQNSADESDDDDVVEIEEDEELDEENEGEELDDEELDNEELDEENDE